MLKNRIAIYVPSTFDGNQPAPVEMIDRWVRLAKIKLASLFGGFTTYQTSGGWYSSVKGLIEEPITVIVAYTDDEGLTKMPMVEQLAKQMAEDMKQEAISVESPEGLKFVTA